MHRVNSGKFSAYAQWPNKETYEAANDIEMAANYELARAKMHNALNIEKTEVIFQMEVEIDYLQRRAFDI
ncbi:MAG: hypothetical protein ABJH28_18010 [Paraglaciecola sp.]|uniref:hypothetical protein n=1 Tax=Paraglaciecola sp. TaxID=1920173 RepID=UPI0032649A2D